MLQVAEKCDEIENTHKWALLHLLGKQADVNFLNSTPDHSITDESYVNIKMYSLFIH